MTAEHIFQGEAVTALPIGWRVEVLCCCGHKLVCWLTDDVSLRFASQADMLHAVESSARRDIGRYKRRCVGKELAEGRLLRAQRELARLEKKP